MHVHIACVCTGVCVRERELALPTGHVRKKTSHPETCLGKHGHWIVPHTSSKTWTFFKKSRCVVSLKSSIGTATFPLANKPLNVLQKSFSFFSVFFPPHIHNERREVFLLPEKNLSFLFFRPDKKGRFFLKLRGRRRERRGKEARQTFPLKKGE